MRSLLPLALAAVVAPSLGAQSVFDAELRLAPQYIQYKIKAPNDEKISELAIPVFVTIPFGSRFTFDVGTSYARAKVTTGSAVSEVSGLTDTQLRGNLTLGTDFIVLTGGLNLPTGKSTVDLDQVTAAGRIGSDFLAFPISNLGTGLAVTGGVAIARPIGDWNIGFGGSMRRSAEYEPFNQPGTTLKFTPGDEYRAKVGVDHSLGNGRVSLGLTYSAFGDDVAGSSIYNTGNRLIAQAVMTNTLSGNDITVAAYNVFRAQGNYANGDPAGRENISNAYVGIGLPVLGTVVEPSVEGRLWVQNVPTGAGAVLVQHTQSSYLGTFGLRTRIGLGGIAAFPSVGYTLGRLAIAQPTNTSVHADMTGFRAQLAVRIAP
ncbi:MAG: hypothetical protein JWL61_2160 [Gemmatimonadetes bacterium]|nr:hypothetical protein [Gemmatimonadota bacterium]